MIIMVACIVLFFVLLPANFLLALIPLCVALLIAVELERK